MSPEFSPNGKHPETRLGEIPRNVYTDIALKSWYDFENSSEKKDVTIHRDKIVTFVLENFDNDFHPPAWQYSGVFPENDKALMPQLIFANTQNFAYSIPELIGETYRARNPRNSSDILEGAFAMQSRVYREFGEKDDVTSDQLRRIFRSENTLAEFYAGENEIPHLDLRMQTGLDLIIGLEKEYDGSIRNLLDSLLLDGHTMQAFHSPTGPGLVDTLVDKFPVAYGDDVQMLGEYPFPFYKRAQLAVLELHGRQQNSEQLVMPLITDINSLGMPIDYEIPKILREKGILEYSEELEFYVDNWIPIPRDSRFEVQIRGADLAASEEILVGINTLRKRDGLPLINRVPLDYMLWSVGTEMKTSYPHLTKTSSY